MVSENDHMIIDLSLCGTVLLLAQVCVLLTKPFKRMYADPKSEPSKCQYTGDL